MEENRKLRERAETLRGLCQNAKNWESDIKSANLNLKSRIEKSNLSEKNETNSREPSIPSNPEETFRQKEQKFENGKLETYFLALG